MCRGNRRVFVPRGLRVNMSGLQRKKIFSQQKLLQGTKSNRLLSVRKINSLRTECHT